MSSSAPLSFGWFIPTLGDTSAFGDPARSIPQSKGHFERVALAADKAGFDYVLIPVTPYCWDAWTVASFVVSRTTKLKALVAVKPGFIHPVAQAKMISTFEQLWDGRLYINLIAGLSEKDAIAEGQHGSKEARYAQLDEEVTLIKRLLSEEAVEHQGDYYHLNKPVIIPKPVQQPWPPIFLGGGSEQAADISVRHSDVHLFWGDYPARIGEQIQELRARAAKYGREDKIRFAMRLQIVCRETEEEAWAAANQLVAGATEWKERAKNLSADMNSAANQRQRELSETVGSKMTPHLWTGITEVRPGAGVAVVGNPQQVAAQLQEFVDVGCSGFCLSGYPHHEEAERFGRLVMPLTTR
ncbi:LLM class flavin-dependent oxidoreductase [Cupriavidus metallidurans]|uniref:LLM class flavin-dependent oxidoreductase n=1 Tax=Cupriavidus metallidurans TaxID=119219 RepID=UPI001CCDD319|nr:LLM class flavin-dependent oxidoreductase [Cupriavidus metallidurans]UBM08814.1 LLM class flavin-dependent oxidoreductase [Cupriavidus metallidurans]